MRSLELSILDILTEDARTPVSQMSVMLGVSQTEIAETIARLEKQRIIIKYPGADQLGQGGNRARWRR